MGSFSLPTDVNAFCKNKQQKPRVARTSAAVWLMVQGMGERDSRVRAVVSGSLLGAPRPALLLGGWSSCRALGKWSVSRRDGEQMWHYLTSLAPFRVTPLPTRGCSPEESVLPAKPQRAECGAMLRHLFRMRCLSSHPGAQRGPVWLLLVPHRLLATVGGSPVDMGREHTSA